VVGLLPVLTVLADRALTCTERWEREGYRARFYPTRGCYVETNPNRWVRERDARIVTEEKPK
jgi:hypothetical protein